MADRGEISESTVEHWDKETKGKKLPAKKKSKAKTWAAGRKGK